MAPLPSGSYLALFDESDTDPAATEAARRYVETGAIPYIYRSPDKITAYFDGFELVEPGVVLATRWRQHTPALATETTSMGGVARKP